MAGPKECLDKIHDSLIRGDYVGAADACGELCKCLCTTPPPSSAAAPVGQPHPNPKSAVQSVNVAGCDQKCDDIRALCAAPPKMAAAPTPGQIGLIMTAIQFALDFWAKWKMS